MKVFFVVKTPFPNGQATTARVINYCRGLIEGGISCEVIIPLAVERFEDKKLNEIPQGIYKGIPYRYISGSVKRNRNLIYRQLKDRIDYIKTLMYIRKKVTNKDIVIVYEGGCLWFKLLTKVIHLVGAKAIMELNELPYGTGIETETAIAARKKMLTKVFPKFDAFITISEALSNLVRQYAPTSYILKVPIIVDENISNNVVGNIVNRPYIFHSGSLFEQKDGIIGMLEAFALANKQLGYKLDFILTGDSKKSRDYQSIKETIENYKIKQYIHFTGYLSYDELYRYQSNSLLMIINKYDTQQNKYCFSTKLGEYLSFSKPIIITNIGEAMSYLNETNSYIVEPNNPQLIADKIVQIYNNPIESKRKGMNGRHLTETIFNYKYQANRMILFFELLESNNR